MKLVYNAQLGDINAFRFSWTHQAVLGADERIFRYKHSANFGEVNFAVFGQADCKAKMDLAEAAFYLPYGNLLVLDDAGGNTTNCIANSATVGGVRPMSLAWSDKPGAQFTTWRAFSCGFEWETQPALPATYLLEFSETVRVQGGTPLIKVQEPVNVPVSSLDEFLFVPKQKYVVTQQGRAVGLFAYPLAPAPLYPNPMTNPGSTTTPGRSGATNQKWAIDWSYSWEFGSLASLPVASLWPS